MSQPVVSDASFNQEIKDLQQKIDKDVDAAVKTFYSKIQADLPGEIPSDKPADQSPAVGNPVDQKPTVGSWGGKSDQATDTTTKPDSEVKPRTWFDVSPRTKPAINPAPSNEPSVATGPKPYFGLASKDPNRERSLPWFKHGLRGFLRKLWYGNHPTNPDWTGVKEQFELYHKLVREAEQFIEQNVHELIPANLNEDANPAVAELTKNLQTIVKQYMNAGIRLGARWAEYDIRTRKGSNSAKPTDTKNAGIELAVKDLLANSPLMSLPKDQITDLSTAEMEQLLNQFNIKLPGVKRSDLADMMRQLIKDIPATESKPVEKKRPYADSPPPSYKVAGEKMDAAPPKHEPWMEPKPEPAPKAVEPKPEPPTKPTDKPKAEKPKSEKPKTDKPKAEKPKEEPKQEDAIEAAARDLLKGKLSKVPKSELEGASAKGMEELLFIHDVKMPGVSRSDLAKLLRKIIKKKK